MEFRISCKKVRPILMHFSNSNLKSRPSENSLEDFSTSESSLFKEEADSQAFRNVKCKIPIENFHPISKKTDAR